MRSEAKLILRRFAIRWLRKLVAAADDRLHAEEGKLRKEISACSPSLTDKPQPGEAVPDNRSQGVSRKRLHAEKAVSPSAVKMAANLKVSGLSVADAASAMRNLGFSAKEVTAVLQS